MAKQPAKIPGTHVPGPEGRKPGIPPIFKKTEISPVMAALSVKTVDVDAEVGHPAASFKVGEIMLLIPGEMIVATVGPEALEQFRNELNNGIDVTSVMPPALTRV